MFISNLLHAYLHRFIPFACQFLPTAMNIMYKFNRFFYCFSLVAHVDYEVGDIVAECNFDESGGSAMETCCDKFDVKRGGYNAPPLYFGYSSASPHTGPSHEHTSGTGMRMNFNEVKMMTV